MSDPYDKWRKRLEISQQHTTVAARRDALKVAGVMTHPQPELDDVGFYRLPLTEPTISKATGQPNGRQTITGWEPVAYFEEGGKLCGCIGVGERDMNDDQVISYWTNVVAYPISESLYRDVVQHGKPWPTMGMPAPEIPAADRDVAMTDNESPQEPLDVQHAMAIKAAIGAAPTAVKSNAEADVALGSKNRIAELRLAAEKAGKAIYEPMYRIYTAEQKKWSPMIALATAKEKELNTAILTFRESERRRIAAEQAEAERKQREIEEANQRAADRAIARGEPEEPPEVIEAAPVAAPVQVTPTYGTRVLKEQMKTFLDEVEDFDLVYNFFKVQSRGQVETFLKDLAERAIKAGFEVPGTKTRKGLI